MAYSHFAHNPLGVGLSIAPRPAVLLFIGVLIGMGEWGMASGRGYVQCQVFPAMIKYLPVVRVRRQG